MTRAEYERSQLPRRKVNSKPKALALRHAITALRDKRREAACWIDPLILARNTRSYRTPSAIATRTAAEQERHDARLAEEACERAASERHDAIRTSLLRAARAARAAGYHVRSSTDRTGRISSYYVSMPGCPSIRISDHELPYSARRDFMAREHGHAYFDGYHGNELIIDREYTLNELREFIDGVTES